MMNILMSGILRLSVYEPFEMRDPRAAELLGICNTHNKSKRNKRFPFFEEKSEHIKSKTRFQIFQTQKRLGKSSRAKQHITNGSARKLPAGHGSA